LGDFLPRLFNPPDFLVVVFFDLTFLLFLLLGLVSMPLRNSPIKLQTGFNSVEVLTVESQNSNSSYLLSSVFFFIVGQEDTKSFASVFAVVVVAYMRSRLKIHFTQIPFMYTNSIIECSG